MARPKGAFNIFGNAAGDIYHGLMTTMNAVKIAKRDNRALILFCQSGKLPYLAQDQSSALGRFETTTPASPRQICLPSTLQ